MTKKAVFVDDQPEAWFSVVKFIQEQGLQVVGPMGKSLPFTDLQEFLNEIEGGQINLQGIRLLLFDLMLPCSNGLSLRGYRTIFPRNGNTGLALVSLLKKAFGNELKNSKIVLLTQKFHEVGATHPEHLDVPIFNKYRTEDFETFKNILVQVG